MPTSSSRVGVVTLKLLASKVDLTTRVSPPGTPAELLLEFLREARVRDSSCFGLDGSLPVGDCCCFLEGDLLAISFSNQEVYRVGLSKGGFPSSWA